MKRVPTILVVDDEEPSRTMITRILRDEGHRVIPIRRGAEAQWFVQRHGTSIDLVVADFAAPETDDYHLGIPIAALLPHTPVLFVSARAREESIHQGLLRPETPFLRKPFPPGVLARRVRAILERVSVPPAA